MISSISDDDEKIAEIAENLMSDSPSTEDIDGLIAEQMTMLSMQDREKVYYDIHGISDQVVETEALIAKSLVDLQFELDSIHEKEAYDIALKTSPSYVQDDELRLMFLRAERFDAKLAALRLIRHFNSKMELFGREKLGRDITQDDLDEDDIEATYCGVSQILPVRDRAGRLVCAFFGCDKQNKLSSQSKVCEGRDRMRRNFYAALNYARDVETQQKGMVVVAHAIELSSSNRNRAQSHAWKVAKLMKDIPLRIEAVHFCHNSLMYLPIISMFQLAIGSFLRLRFRSHYGSISEGLQSLQSFGIPVEVFPLTPEGELLTDIHTQMLENLRRQERMSNKSTTVVRVPGKLDVLFGRGRRNHQHVGNVRYRILVEEYKPRYDKERKLAKTRISSEIVKMIKQKGGRFLKEDEEIGWVEVDDDAARTKVSHTFRTMRAVTDVSKQSRKKQAKALDDESTSLSAKRFRPTP